MQFVVVDTSVFLSDPKSLSRLSDKHVVIPLAVIIELEEKRNHSELGYSARTVLRQLEEYRRTYTILDEPIPTPLGGSVRIELNHVDEAHLPDIMADGSTDSRILAVALNLSMEGKDVTLLTKDLPMRLRASVVGLRAEDFITDNGEDNFTDTVYLEVELEDMEELYNNGKVPLYLNRPNTGVIVTSGNTSALAKTSVDGLTLIRERTLFDVKGRNAEQKIAMEFLSDNRIPIVSLGGRAGSGKSLLALAAGLEHVLENKTFKKIIIFRPLYAVGNQDLGYLPGSAEEKMDPWTAAVFDTLGDICNDNVIDHIIDEQILEVLPLTHIRGRTLNNAFVIIDEAQQLEKMVLLTALTRLGKNSRVVLTHDINQRDNLRVGKHDGIMSVARTLSGNALFAHVSLCKSERSAVAEMVSSLLED